MRTFKFRSDSPVVTGLLAVSLALTASVGLSACGGGSSSGSDTTMPTAQPTATERERAALARASAINQDALGRVRAERAMGPARQP